MDDRRILYWYLRAMWLLAGRWVLLFIVVFWIIGSLLPDPKYPEPEPHWKNEDPSRHPSEVKKLDYSNRLIIWKTPEEIERDKFVPKQVKESTTAKSRFVEPEEIDIEEWIELNMD